MMGHMPKSWSPSPDILALVQSQAGVLSREQCRLFGVGDNVTSRLVSQGWWRRLTPGIYITDQQGWQTDAWAGVLMGGGDAVLGAEAAAHLHGLMSAPATITVFVGDAQPRPVPGWEFIRATRRGIGELPRTRVADTILDLAGRVSEDELVAVISDAVSRRQVTLGHLRTALGERTRQPKRKVLADIVGDVSHGVRSALERRYLVDVERAHGLPVGVRQVRTAAGEVDVGYDPYGLLTELDGVAHHRGRQLATDRHRDNVHRLQGYTTLRFGWAEVTGDPCAVADEVAAALRACGWTGMPTPCHRCRRRRAS